MSFKSPLSAILYCFELAQQVKIKKMSKSGNFSGFGYRLNIFTDVVFGFLEVWSVGY